MPHLSPFCTCKNTACPLHPTNHDRGCAPCIAKNLKLREMPNCFFDKIPDSETRPGDTFPDFARLVLNEKEKETKKEKEKETEK